MKQKILLKYWKFKCLIKQFKKQNNKERMMMTIKNIRMKKMNLRDRKKFGIINKQRS